jgi:uncharacterized protein (TIGR03086 family)
MKAKDIFEVALATATTFIDQIEPDDYQRSTPNSEWNVRRLAGHLLYELCWVRDMVAGKTIDEVGTAYDGDLLGNAPAANWHASAESARVAVQAANLKSTVHTSAGDIPVEEYLMQISLDLLVHAWDLAKGLDVTIQLDPAACKAVYEYITPHAASWQEGGFFARPVTVPKNADVQTKLIALTGRDPDWSAQRQ